MAKRSIVLSAASTKGGVGKSSIISNLGAYLATKGKKILFIDLDPQANLTSCMNNVSKQDKANACMLRAYQHDSKDVRSAFPLNFKPAKVNQNVDILTSSRQIIHAGNLMRNRPSFASYVILHVFTALQLTKRYDYILIDCHNSFNVLTKGAMVVSDYVMTPIQPGRFSVSSIASMVECMKDLKANLINPVTQQPFITAKLFFVGNMVDFNTKSSHQFSAAIKNNAHFVASFHRRELFNRATTNYRSIYKQAQMDAERHNYRNQETVDNEIKPNMNRIIKYIGGNRHE